MTALACAMGMGALASLRQFYFHRNRVGDPGMAALTGAIRSGWVRNLHVLNLRQNRIGDER